MASKSCVTVENVSKSYNKRLVIDQVSLQIPNKSIFGILGPNGSGKSTLLRLIGGVHTPDSGSITKHISALALFPQASLGYLPEEKDMHLDMPVAEQMIYWGAMNGLEEAEALKNATKLLKKFGINHVLEADANDLSKGERQRVRMVAALLHAPQLLLLDEPFVGLDRQGVEQFVAELKARQKKGVTIVLAMRPIPLAEEICSHVAFLNHGQLLLASPLEDFIATYRQPIYELQFGGNMIAFANALWTSADILSQEQDEDKIFTVRIHLRKRYSIAQILPAMIRHLQVHSVKKIDPSLVDLFEIISTPEIDEKRLPKVG